MLHDGETDLCTLDTKWNLVKLQKSWKLKCCYRPTITMQQAENTDVRTVSGDKQMNSLAVEYNGAAFVLQESLHELVTVSELDYCLDNIESNTVSAVQYSMPVGDLPLPISSDPLPAASASCDCIGN